MEINPNFSRLGWLRKGTIWSQTLLKFSESWLSRMQVQKAKEDLRNAQVQIRITRHI